MPVVGVETPCAVRFLHKDDRRCERTGAALNDAGTNKLKNMSLNLHLVLRLVPVRPNVHWLRPWHQRNAVVACPLWRKPLRLPEDIFELSDQKVNRRRNGTSIFVRELNMEQVDHVGERTLFVQAHQQQTVNLLSCGRRCVPAQMDGATGSADDGVLGNPIHHHKTMSLEPIHAENSIVSSQGQNLHVGVEFVPLR